METDGGKIDLLNEKNNHSVAEIIESIKAKRWYPFKSESGLQFNVLDSIPAVVERNKPFILLLKPDRIGDLILSAVPVISCDDGSQEKENVRITDSIESGSFLKFIEDIVKNRNAEGRHGKLGLEGEFIAEFASHFNAGTSLTPLNIEQSNSSFVIGDQFICKFMRKVEPGENPDITIPHKLYMETQFRNTPRPIGQLVYRDRQPFTLMSIHSFIRNQGDYWKHFTGEAASMAEREKPGSAAGGKEYNEKLAVPTGEIARVIGEMHMSLAKLNGKDYAPLPAGENYISSIKKGYLQMVQMLGKAGKILETGNERVNVEELSTDLELILHKINFSAFSGSKIIRIHGDLHLGQILKTESGPMVIDFEGEPLRPLKERSMKQSPLKDVAGIIRSIDYAMNFNNRADPSDSEKFIAYSEGLRKRFLEEYWEVSSGFGLLPDSFAKYESISQFFELEKAIYELNYEISNRPEWSGIPARAIFRIMRRFQ